MNCFSKEMFFLDFDVNFSKSNTKIDSCKVYYIESETKSFNVKNCEKSAFFILSK